MNIDGNHPDLEERLVALADLTDDSDWNDVRRRANALTPPPRATRPTAARRGWRRLALAVILALGVGAASPAVGLGDPIGAAADGLSSLFRGEPEEHFSTHNGTRLPLYLQVGGRSEDGGSSEVITGKVFSAKITSLELVLADGSVVALALDARREFRYDNAATQPTQLIARDADGKVVTRLPVIHPSGRHDG